MEKKTPAKKTTPRAAAKPAAKKVEPKAAKRAAKPAVSAAEPAAAISVTAKGALVALGRRKTATAQVRLFPNGKGEITVNKRPYVEYFPIFDLRETVLSPLKLAGRDKSVDISALVRGGGLRGQADAVKLGIARALLLLDETLHRTLRKTGHLTRDARKKERKKYGLKKARRAPQWAKR